MLRISSSKRWLRECMKLVITTSSGERSSRSAAPAETLNTITRSTGPANACHSGTLSTTPPSTNRRSSCSTIGNTPGSAALASSAGFERPTCEHDLFTRVEVGGDHAQGNREIGEAARGCGPVDQRVEPRRFEEVRLAAHEVPGPAQPAPGEHLGAREGGPDGIELRDTGEIRGVRHRRAVQRTGRGTDHDVGDDAPLEHRPQHPDLGHALIPATRQHERRARRGEEERLPVRPVLASARHAAIRRTSAARQRA